MYLCYILVAVCNCKNFFKRKCKYVKRDFCLKNNICGISSNILYSGRLCHFALYVVKLFLHQNMVVWTQTTRRKPVVIIKTVMMSRIKITSKTKINCHKKSIIRVWFVEMFALLKKAQDGVRSANGDLRSHFHLFHFTFLALFIFVLTVVILNSAAIFNLSSRLQWNKWKLYSSLTRPAVAYDSEERYMTQKDEHTLLVCMKV